MKQFWTAVATVLLMAGAVSFLFTAEATVQDSFWADIAQGNMTEIEAGTWRCSARRTNRCANSLSRW
jgi:hypothetical protein